jgi:undecaprenyl-diphosphatase
MLGFKEPELLMDCSLHLGTLLAVCIYFRSDLKEMTRMTGLFISDLRGGRRRPKEIHENPYAALTLWVFIGTLPTVFIGLVFRSPLERMFNSVGIVGAMLLVTGTILAATRLVSKGYNSRKDVGLPAALAVGIAQGMAIIPGISRSGATIVCGMLFRVERDLAGRFSFLLAIPAIIGALVLQLNAEEFNRVGLLPLASGLVSSTLVGLIALKILMGMVRRGNLFYFAPYCWVLGILVIAFRV